MTKVQEQQFEKLVEKYSAKFEKTYLKKIISEIYMEIMVDILEEFKTTNQIEDDEDLKNVCLSILEMPFQEIFDVYVFPEYDPQNTNLKNKFLEETEKIFQQEAVYA